jgi:hypothetical protein
VTGVTTIKTNHARVTSGVEGHNGVYRRKLPVVGVEWLNTPFTVAHPTACMDSLGGNSTNRN